MRALRALAKHAASPAATVEGDRRGAPRLLIDVDREEAKARAISRSRRQQHQVVAIQLVGASTAFSAGLELGSLARMKPAPPAGRRTRL